MVARTIVHPAEQNYVSYHLNTGPGDGDDAWLEKRRYGEREKPPVNQKGRNRGGCSQKRPGDERRST